MPSSNDHPDSVKYNSDGAFSLDILAFNINEILSSSSSFGFSEIFYQKGFTDSESDATATIDVCANHYDNLFKLNIPIYDALSNIEGISSENLRYYTNASGWKDVSFSEAIVDKDKAILASYSDQSIKRDFVRSMLKDITGTTRLNNLFKNQGTLMAQISNLDSSFNNEIKKVFTTIQNAGWLTNAHYGDIIDGSQGYVFHGEFRDYSTDPNDLTDVSSGILDLSNSGFSQYNPLRILASSILGEHDNEDEISGHKTRRESLIANLSNSAELFWNDNSNNEYRGVDSSSNVYRVWLQNTTDASNNGAVEESGEMFSKFLSGHSLFVVDVSDSYSGNNLITHVVDVSYAFRFKPGDSLNLLIKYNPQPDSFSTFPSEPQINSRTYKVKLNMT